MSACPACSAPNPDDAAFCARCGAPIDDLGATRVTGDDPTVLRPSPTTGSGAPRDRFEPGTIVAERYRVVALLGRGGMGEVYRADDLRLGQSVALKFLPRDLERDPERRRRFLDEVRTARQVTHANVCRVHDVDEFEGQTFLSMEYVDGEDLASLLRRIGRLPEERAVEVARQICAGLAAAHDAGVLHRDLKPANVMLDGRGHVKLTDFGLASLATETSGDDARAGTPAYMAPEQLSGEGVSSRSDVYALGLVLYELFTGRPVFRADTIAELSSLHASSVPSRPTDHVGTLDPAIESAVLRCLEKRPERRPASALAVAAALPGGDPLAAALAAGETPSPELVAESGVREALRPGVALGLAALALALLLGGSYWAATMSWQAFIPFDKRPEVLQDRALELMRELGYSEDVYQRPADRAWGWLVWGDVMQQIADTDSLESRWESARDRPDVGSFWYRQSPRPLVPVPYADAVFVRGPVTLVNPQPVSAGEVMVLFDLDGSLRRFEVMPRRFARDEPSEPDWTPLFVAAELDTARFRPVRPRYQRFMSPDLSRAWLGTIEDQPGVEYRVEAGAHEGRVVLFNVVEASTLENLGAAPETLRPSFGARVMNLLPPLLIVIVVLLISRLAVENAVRQRSDARGAARFAGAMLVLFLLVTGLRSHTLFSWNFAQEFWLLLVASIFVGFATWAMYSAVEPVGRSVWPTMFVSSSRLLSRDRPQLRDPLLGRSVLVGMVVGSAWFLLVNPALRMLRDFVAADPPWPFSLHLELLHGGARALAQVVDLPLSFALAFLQISALVLLQRAFKRRWLAAAIAVLVWTVIEGFGSWFYFGIALSTSVVLMLTLLRWGVVAFVVMDMSVSLAWHARTVDATHWAAAGAIYGIAAAILLAAYGAWAATGDSQPTRR